MNPANQEPLFFILLSLLLSQKDLIHIEMDESTTEIASSFNIYSKSLPVKAQNVWGFENTLKVFHAILY